jgi:predicted dehydrogenase
MKNASAVAQKLQRSKREFDLTWTIHARHRPVRQSRANKAPRKVAVIGAGAMGQDQCLGLQTLTQFEIGGVADKHSDALDRLRQHVSLPDTRFYTNVGELLNERNWDLVCVATNTTAHLDVARQAIESGVRRLIVEKPIGNNLAEARRFAALCQSRGVKVAVNHSRRWVEDYAAVNRCIANGFIGSLRQVYAAPGPGGLAMIGSHYFDLLSYLTGSTIAWVRGFLEEPTAPNKRGPQFKDPGGHCTIGFHNGVRGYLDVSDDLGRWDGLVVLRGDSGRIEIDERTREWHLVSSSLGRRTFKFLDTTRISVCFAKVAAQVMSDEAPFCGLSEGIQALEGVIAAHLSNERGHESVSLPIPEDDADREMQFP